MRAFKEQNMSDLIVLCPNPFRDTGLELTLQAKALLETNGYRTEICPVFGADDPEAIPAEVKISDWAAVSNEATLFIIIGGDGTMLHAARYLNHTDTPMLGINLGTKGFMAPLEPDKLDLIVDAAAGNYVSSHRMMIDVELKRNGKVIYSDVGLNDVVIHGMGDCVKLTAWCDGDMMVSFSGDGIIVATPTGSTGYSMSAGGPIVEPEAKNFIVSPICAHVMGAKTFVLGPDRKVTVKAEKIHDRRAYVAVDGAKGIDLANDDIVTVRQSRKVANLVHMGLSSFYDSTFDKLLYKNR